MIKPTFYTGVLFLMVMTGETMAACNDLPNQVTDLNTLLEGHTLCDATATYDTSSKYPLTGGPVVMGIQEEHRAGGELWDFKRGPSSQIDPPTQVGSWSVSGTDADSAVTYTYLGGAGGGTYKVYNNNDGTYDLCDGATKVATVSIVNSIDTGCSGFNHGAP